MSSISRYKKTGGFLQLVSLIETFGGPKRDKFVEMVEAESPVWAKALREKMLSIERIFSWPDDVVIEVFKNLPPKNMAVVLEGIKPEQKARLLAYFSSSDKRRLDDALVDKPKPEEITANLVKLVEYARKMLVQRDLHPEKFDATLALAEDIEHQLEAQTGQAFVTKMATQGEKEADGTDLVFPGDPAPAAPATAAGHPPMVSNHELQQLQRSLATVLKENKTLKDELRVAREKLEQIRKIA